VSEPPAPRTVLVVEDDLAIRRGVADALRYAGFSVREAGDGASGALAAVAEGVDLVLLDLVLPRLDGLEVLRRLRRESPTLPVIVLTARGEERDRVAGLELGADDYVVKPFGARELLARVEAVLRRSPERPRPVGRLRLGGAEADLDRGEVRFADGGREELSGLEADLLRYLASHPARVVSREELLTRVWQKRARLVATRTVDMTVARLRRKLRDGGDPPRLVTVRGRGYRLDQDPGEARGEPPEPGP
jgi:DNA-binding response OmpR family regulator